MQFSASILLAMLVSFAAASPVAAAADLAASDSPALLARQQGFCQDIGVVCNRCRVSARNAGCDDVRFICGNCGNPF
ncbi:hypothetical protein CDD81_5638 [Ophiocordyceps australis]|uniref:Uncharacterized protein n=1 Tax=Ophiocordyceps australis TaxID=1399860 RepID=A0A2C5Y4M7_9HYPO|nr:hypothetical protein CDD81_5638 [Ophiocordyceps australis]